MLTDFNMHWLDSELQTIIYTDLSLSARINLLACLSLSRCALCSSFSFCLASSCSFSSHFCSKLLKIQVTLLNNLSRKSFGRSHQIAHYGITYLSHNSNSLRLLSCLLFSFLSTFLSLKCQEIASVKHLFIAQVYCANGLIFLLNFNLKYIHSLRSSAPLTEKVTKFNMNINLIEQGSMHVKKWLILS